jgi:hypothetical protein
MELPAVIVTWDIKPKIEVDVNVVGLNTKANWIKTTHTVRI